MSSDYLKAIAAGGEFDTAEAIRELAKVLVGGGKQGVAEGLAVGAPVAGDVEIIPPLVEAPEPTITNFKGKVKSK